VAVPERWHLYVVDLGRRVGTRPGKHRPCLAIQPPGPAARVRSTVILPLTTRLAAGSAFPLRVRIPDGTCGLRTSDIMIDQILAWDNSRFGTDLGQLPEGLQLAVQDALIEFFDLAA
jgi:mRNA-degrading endonuclease toxin of MazEF toxin-antitoxin module